MDAKSEVNGGYTGMVGYIDRARMNVPGREFKSVSRMSKTATELPDFLGEVKKRPPPL